MPRPDSSLVHKIVQLAGEGMKRRAIARALRLSRNTVRRVLEDHALAREAVHTALPSPPARAPRPSILDAHRPLIDALLGKYPRITAQRVFEELRGAGYGGGYTRVKDVVAEKRPRPAPTPSLETPPRVPGDLGECDWSPYKVAFTHAKVEVQAFGYTLRYSTRKYYGFYEGNGLHPLMDGHVQTFARFKGAARRCKYDSQKPVVLRWEGDQPIYNPRFIDFAVHYEFGVVACTRGEPNEKPRVERSFWELEQSFFNGRSFRDLADLKAQLAYWLDNVADRRPLSKDRRHTRLALFAEEQPLLRPLPRHPYDTAQVAYRICDLMGFVPWEGNWYSLPYEHVTELLPIRVTASELFVYKPDLTCVARHALRPRGAQERAVLPGHRPPRAEHGPDLDQLRAAFAALGGPAPDFLAALERQRPRSAGHHARRVLALREGFSCEDLALALAHALAHGAVEHDAVERILLARARPRRLDEYVAEEFAQRQRAAVDESQTEPRDLAEYDTLPCRGAAPAPSPMSATGESICASDPAPAPPTRPASGSRSTSTG
jgi:transposase